MTIIDFAVLKKLRTGVWIKRINLVNGYYEVEVFWKPTGGVEPYVHPDADKRWVKTGFATRKEAEEFYKKLWTVRVAKKKNAKGGEET